MRQWSRAKTSADGSRPRSAPRVHMQEYPEVRTRSRTVQRGSGGTRRRVLKKRSSPEPDRRTDPLSTQEAFSGYTSQNGAIKFGRAKYLCSKRKILCITRFVCLRKKNVHPFFWGFIFKFTPWRNKYKKPFVERDTAIRA
ncbi:hypothetical protein [Desulfosporosinus orientis]|uniref:hypothetical protein n=1 Tax=Desulfosporosinus orientis TaxID=1563 RepID=UPI0013051102|nr:hypothetical protein [Desulfosporosinus orientis]